MAHEITCFIASTDVTIEIAKSISLDIPITKRPQGLALLPIPFELSANKIASSFATDYESFVAQFEVLPQELKEAIVKASFAGPVAFIVTEYSGGMGYQGAMVFQAGEIVYGPIVDESVSEIRSQKLPTVAPPDPTPINGALKLLGVKRIDDRDEFDAIGLGNKRSTSEYLQ